MRSRWSKIARVSALIAILAVALVTVGVLSPEGREAIEHYQCSKRDEARAEAVFKLIGATLKEGESTRTDVRQFLEQYFTDFPIHESEPEISAGPMFFSFDQGGVLAESLQEVGCPID
jgi:hypothetical protein